MQIMKVAEVAKYLRVSPCTVYRLVNEKEIPHIKFSESYIIRFCKETIDYWIDQQIKLSMGYFVIKPVKKQGG